MVVTEVSLREVGGIALRRTNGGIPGKSTAVVAQVKVIAVHLDVVPGHIAVLLVADVVIAIEDSLTAFLPQEDATMV